MCCLIYVYLNILGSQKFFATLPFIHSFADMTKAAADAEVGGGSGERLCSVGLPVLNAGAPYLLEVYVNL